MSLFGSKESLNPRLMEVWAKPEAHRGLGRMEEAIRRAQSTLLTLDSAEQLVMFSVIWSDKYKDDGMIAVTAQHVIEIGDQGNTRKRFPIAQIAEVRHLQSGNCGVIQALTHEAQNYKADTKDQWPHMILVSLATANIAYQVCEVIKKMIR